jgi:hypothetical protein
MPDKFFTAETATITADEMSFIREVIFGDAENHFIFLSSVFLPTIFFGTRPAFL